MSNQKRIRRGFRAVEGDWRRVDLHLHTPASADWQEPDVTYLEWLQKAESKGLDIVAITDHNTVEGVAKLRAEIERLAWLEANDRLRPQERRELDEYRRIGDKILVLPGFEFTAMFGFHILAIFPPETSLRKLELLLLRLNVPDNRLTEGSTEVGASTDVLTAYRLINEAGGIVIAAHANSTHGVALQGLSFGGQTKIAFTQDPNLHALEVTDLESSSRRATARFFDGSKPEYPRRMHCIQGSDAHRLNRDPKDKNRLGVGERVTEILLPDVSFDALKAVFEGDDFTRTRPYRPPAEVPFDHVQAAREQGNTIIQAFHESFTREGGRLNKVLCDAVAFANTNGGTIYIGASAVHKMPPKGVQNAEQAVSLLRREIERSITPPLDARVDVIQSLGLPIVRIIVPNGADKPYALNQTRVYVRQEGETNEAVRDELVQLVLTSQHAAPAGGAEPALPALNVESIAAAGETPPPELAVEALAESIPQPAHTPLVSSEEVPLPSIGVEIIGMEERKGSRYFIIRDLRNGNTVQNVTMQSARKLWSYAISQYLTNPVDSARVEWRGNFGLWQAARRAKALRYDLALRQPDGAVRVFYGVTGDGMTGPWSQFLKAEDRGESETEFQGGVAPELVAEWEAASAVGDEVETGLVNQPATLPLPVSEAEPKPARRSRRPRSKKPAEAAPTGQAEAEAEVALVAVAPAPLAVAELPLTLPDVEASVAPEAEPAAVPAAPEAEPMPKPRTRRSRAKPQPEATAEPAATPAASAPESEPAPKPRTRRSRAKPQPAAKPAVPASEAPDAEAAEAKPAPRSRKPKAKASAEAAPAVE